MEREKKRPGQSRRKPWARLFALFVGALILASQASSLSHLLLVEHAVCPVHGEWLHADELDAHAATSPSEARRGDTSVLAPAPPLGSEHAHEHCAVASDRRPSITDAPYSPSLALPFGSRAIALSSSNRFGTHSVPLLHLAPKNSPPV